MVDCLHMARKFPPIVMAYATLFTPVFQVARQGIRIVIAIATLYTPVFHLVQVNFSSVCFQVFLSNGSGEACPAFIALVQFHVNRFNVFIHISFLSKMHSTLPTLLLKFQVD